MRFATPLRLALLTAGLLGLTGCGTTHYFVPARPLGEDETAVYVTWHYDLNGLYTPRPVPDVHVYWGVDENLVLGLGVQAPIYVSHLSALKYWEEEDDYVYSFLHLGQVAGVNTNPLVEAGAGYALHQSAVAEQFELGLAYGNGSAAPLLGLDPAYAGNRRLMPLARVQVAGADAGASLQYYHGLTRTNLCNLEQTALSSWDGPKKLLWAEDIDSAAFYPEEVSNFGRAHLIIFLKSGGQIDLLARKPERENDLPFLVRLLPTPGAQLPSIPPDSLPLMDYSGFGPGDSGRVTFLLLEEPLIGSVNSVAAALERGEDLILRSRSDVQAEIIHRLRRAKGGFWNDLSIGAAAVHYSRE